MEIREAVEEAPDSQALHQIQSQVEVTLFFNGLTSYSLNLSRNILLFVKFIETVFLIDGRKAGTVV